MPGDWWSCNDFRPGGVLGRSLFVEIVLWIVATLERLADDSGKATLCRTDSECIELVMFGGELQFETRNFSSKLITK